MTIISTELAAKRLMGAIQVMGKDEMLLTYNALFPEAPASRELAIGDSIAIMERISAYFNQGMRSRDILAIWPVVFAREKITFFDEVKSELHIEEEVPLMEVAAVEELEPEFAEPVE